ncbi:hypothetical protein Dimus_014902 [Dionaea muscipula]
MGRVKLEIKKLENSNGRQVTYSKRKHGILKKAEELSILCDIDIVLVMFSPSGKPSLCCGKRSFEEVIAKFAEVPAQERTKRKIEGLEALKKTFKKVDHNINVQELLCLSPSTIKDFTDQAKALQSRLSGIQKRLSCWANLDSVNDMTLLMQMEDSLKESLLQIQREKEKFRNQQPVSFESNCQLHADMHPPFHLDDEQELEPLYWGTNNVIQQMEEESKLPTQRISEWHLPKDIECSGSSSIFGEYFPDGGSSSSTKPELTQSGQVSNLKGFSGNACPGQLVVGQSQNLLNNSNMLADSTSQALLSMNEQGSGSQYNIAGQCQSPVAHFYSNRLLQETSADSLFAELLHFQRLSGVPSALLQPSYKRAAKDPSQILFELLNCP